MSDVLCKAIIISETSYNENDKMLTAISDTFGKISISAKGAKKPSARNLAISQLFCYSEFELAEGKNGVYTLRGGTLISSFYDLRTDLDILIAAEKICRTASKISQEELPDEMLLRLLLNSLYALEHKLMNIELIIAVFSIRAVYDQGLLPAFNVKFSGTAKALAFITGSDYSKLFAFKTSSDVTAEICSVGKKALKFIA